MMIHATLFDRGEIFRRLRYLQPGSGFRESFQYNNLMYVTAGHLVGRVAGCTWEDFVAERLLRPLGMNDTTFPAEVMRKSDDSSLAYTRRSGKGVVCIPLNERRDVSAPAGGLRSNVEELLRWVQFQLDAGKIGEKLSPGGQNRPVMGG